jgi:hypothetical protein
VTYSARTRLGGGEEDGEWSECSQCWICKGSRYGQALSSWVGVTNVGLGPVTATLQIYRRPSMSHDNSRRSLNDNDNATIKDRNV